MQALKSSFEISIPTEYFKFFIIINLHFNNRANQQASSIVLTHKMQDYETWFISLGTVLTLKEKTGEANTLNSILLISIFSRRLKAFPDVELSC